MKTILNPDEDYVKEIKQDLKGNNGYCPCKLVHIPENKCPCKEFREMKASGKPGMCSCGLYILVDEENTDA